MRSNYIDISRENLDTFGEFKFQFGSKESKCFYDY